MQSFCIDGHLDIENILYPSIVYNADIAGLCMAHTVRDKKKLLNRVRRLRGQLDALETALDKEHDCHAILQLIAACRGAINGIMAEVIEGHIRMHVIDPDLKPTSEQAKAAQDLIDVLRDYLK